MSIYNKEQRKELAFKYIRGKGIELCSLHQSLEVPQNVLVHYVDCLGIGGLLQHYPDLSNNELIIPDIVTDAENLTSIGDEEYNFCIANNVLEHMRDPIGAMLNWLRVLKPGGIIYMSLPDVENPLDKGRTVTELDHLIKDYLALDDHADYLHFIECAKFWNKLHNYEDIERLAQENFKRQYSIHYHTFNKTSIHEMLSYMKNKFQDLFEIIECVENEINGVKEYIFIIEKCTYIESIIKQFGVIQKNHKKINIDVVVPVFNAYNDLLKCLYSLVKHWNGYRIVLIDDKSTDTRILELFHKLKNLEGYCLVLLENSENMGFVRTSNRGMKYSNHDVILLNSDTIVTSNWSSKIYHKAYLQEKIATVTPLTNNGTICSVPEFLKDNAIPAGFTIEAFGHLIESIPCAETIKAPTAVGFCMFIKRSVLKRIGYFDEFAFGRGYSEENDFSQRAIANGYINIICTDTFVYHKGSSSFSDIKKELYDHNLSIVSDRYPHYLPSVGKFRRENPVKSVHDKIYTLLPIWDVADKDKRILIILHSYGGGTEKIVMELIESLKTHYEFFLLQVYGNKLSLKRFNNNHMIKYEFQMSKSLNASTLYDNDYRNLVIKIIDTFNINLIHVNHLSCHTLDIFRISEELQIPLILSFHDYYIMCPAIFLVNDQGMYCYNVNNLEQCDRCIEKKLKQKPGFVLEWRSNIAKLLKGVTMFVVSNHAVFDIIRKCYELPDEKLAVIEPGHQKELIELSNKKLIRRLHKPGCIAYIGVLDSSHKGMDLFYALSRSPRLRDKARWKIIGVSELHNNPGYYADYNVEVYGKFKDYLDLKNALNDVDIVIHPSLCETYAYTLSEAWANGLPVITANVGIPPLRVAATGGGWVIDSYNIKSVEDTILSILDSPEDYDKKVQAVQKIQLNSMDNFKRSFIYLYRSVQLPVNHVSKVKFDLNEVFSAIQKDRVLAPSSAIQIETAGERQTSVTDSFTKPILDPNEGLPLSRRFIKCLQENDVEYTVRRTIIFIKNRIH